LCIFLQKHIPEKRAFQRSLLRWYDRYKRDLPWRKTPDPYRILVSEFMLQQTRVETVIPYFERFLSRFPSLEALAKTSPQKVLQAWAGLGYYARARNLQKAAKTIREVHGGKIPSAKRDLLALPGVGPYIAGAVASLAFNKPEAALDGNVKRVFSRLLDLRRKKPADRQRKILERIVENIIPPGRAADFNQALMDLGARVCIPTRPRCSVCPLIPFCSWRGVDTAPKARLTTKTRQEIWVVALIEKNGRFLIHRKEGTGLLAGLWQFPTVVFKRGEKFGEVDGKEQSKEKEALKTMVLKYFGLRAKIQHLLPPQEHRFTHIHAMMRPYLCSFSKIIRPPDPIEMRWVKPSNFSRYPISRAMAKITALLKDIRGEESTLR
jgi:A/G-specific adenine glycosylase